MSLRAIYAAHTWAAVLAFFCREAKRMKWLSLARKSRYSATNFGAIALLSGCAHEADNVRAGERFTARKIGLEDAELGGFLKDARPGFRGKFVGARLQFQRIGTVDAVERAAVREFRDESQGVGRRFVHWN